ncbi:uncharacterized protein PGTG_21461 [Puccinia graminis f. sp. tritici CRL 75-36-700-3]|uniref:CCHC-type domain-containing protein n=1 Tax=Puccinia graminis f. sp. tritici (strain CRL 75-36-700-3 / race SCCL) TaxID=418459 RepID=H6QRI2_PUCGT|nr:uncharacterized protein PGTG_21461 [Puccinia graminis f. sp. tritici CRL 75-36-700-3]EHS63266.1 hypothetical protein PGTG_21461 [Puccinia graminis f. sp. tritici CRL 75-36-700-3]
MNVDVKGNHPTEDVKPSVKPLTPAPPQLHSEVNVGKILKAWPNKDCPKFKGTPGEDARDCQNETCQEFYERFRDWQTKAKTYGYQYDKKTTFVKKLIRGLATEHDHKHRKLHPVASTSGGGSGKRQSDGDYGWDRKKKSSCLACYNCKKEGHVLAKFPEPKTDCQKAWEAKHAEEKANKEKKRSQW